MKRHLVNDQLIAYKFKLTSTRKTEQIKAHLEKCLECQRNFEVLNQKFYALDILREKITVPENAISEVLNRVREVSPAQKAPLFKYRYGWLAGLTAATAVIIFLLISRPKPVEIVSIDKSRTMPPFAPASNIELVTLPRREKVQLTIYNDADLTLVREQRNLTMKTGWNWLQFMWANTLIDPTSLSLEPVSHKNKVEIQELVFPPRLRELGRWLIFSNVSGEVPVELTYFTSGLSWRAFYMGTLSADEATMILTGYVRVTNGSGEDYENAQTRLIVGKIHAIDRIAELARRQYPYSRPGERDAGIAGEILNMIDRREKAEKDGRVLLKEIKKEGLSEYFLYTIEGTETISDGWGKRLPSFEASGIPVTGLYKYDEEQWGNQVISFLSFANDKTHKLGQTPIPNGRIKIYRHIDEEQHLTYVGGTDIKYIPVEEEVELNLGQARYVTVEPKEMEFSMENFLFDKDGNISGWDEIHQWQVEVNNTRSLPVKVEITRGFGTPYWDLSVKGGLSYKKHDVTHARFTLELAPRSKEVFTYTLTTYHGQRQEKHNK